MSINDFVIERMTAYLYDGADAKTAAHFTQGEFEAIFKGDHYSRNNAGQIVKTPPIENLPLETAAAKCKTAIEAFLNSYNNLQQELPQTERRGIDALEHYIAHGIALLPCIKDGNRYRPITKKENWHRTATTDIEKIKAYIEGDKQWTGAGINEKGAARLFRFIPKNYGYVVIDIDCGHTSGGNGINNFYQWLESAGIYKPQLPSYLQDFNLLKCFVTTPSGGLHLYFKATAPDTRITLETLDAEKKLTNKLTDEVELFYSEPITAAGSVKENGEYVLYGELENAQELPPILLRRVKKTDTKKETQSACGATPTPQRAVADRPQQWTRNFQNTNLELYKAHLVDYLNAKGINAKQGEFIPCLCHTDGNTPNMQVNTDYLYCHSCKERLDIFGVAAILAKIGNDKKDFPKVIDEVKRVLGA